MDAFDLDRPAPVTFRFYTPQRPERLMDGVRLGPVDMRYEAGLGCDIAPLKARFPEGDPAGDALYAITLTTPQPVSRGFFTFSFTGRA